MSASPPYDPSRTAEILAAEALQRQRETDHALALPRLRDGVVSVRSSIELEREGYEIEVRKARKAGKDLPIADLPRASSARWVKWAADRLDEVEDWFTDADLLAATDEDPAGIWMRELLDYGEFKLLADRNVVIEIRWTRKAIVRTNVRHVGDEPKCGRAKVVPLPDRLAWTGGGEAPHFRLELSLPWFLLAEHDEVLRGLHDLLASLTMRGSKPVICKPDAVCYAETIARFGVATWGEAAVVHHAMRHPQNRATLQTFNFDPQSGQGTLWTPGPPPRDELARNRSERVARSGKDIAAEQGNAADGDSDLDSDDEVN